jgi:hypothetical protein
MLRAIHLKTDGIASAGLASMSRRFALKSETRSTSTVSSLPEASSPRDEY